MVVEWLLGVLVGLADTIMVAAVGESAVASVSLLGFGVLGVWMAMILDWCVRSAVFMVRYHRGKWEKHGGGVLKHLNRNSDYERREDGKQAKEKSGE